MTSMAKRALAVVEAKGEQGALAADISQAIGLPLKRVGACIGYYIEIGLVRRELEPTSPLLFPRARYFRTEKPLEDRRSRPRKPRPPCAAAVDGIPCQTPRRKDRKSCCNEHGEMIRASSYSATKAKRRAPRHCTGCGKLFKHPRRVTCSDKCKAQRQAAARFGPTLPPMQRDERRLYIKLRKYGIPRAEALATISP